MKKHVLLTIGLSLTCLFGAGAQTTFTQITNGAIVNDPGQFTGCAWGDFNNDGFLDLVVCNYGSLTNVFYLNNGDGTFTKVSLGNPVQDGGYHIAPAIGDFDNDGNLDLFVSAGAFAPSATHNMLYHNNGNGTFSAASGGVVTNQLGRFGPGNWADYDNDGFLDLFVINHGVANDNGAKNIIYHNNGDGTFTSVTSNSIVSDIGVGFCAVWEDYDNDGFVDLLVLNYEANALNFLYHNNGNGTFTRITTNIVGSDVWPQGTQCAAWGDYDNDGLPDLFITDNKGVRNQLYHNNGNGSFSRVTSGPELVPAAGGWSIGCSWGDYDNDGYLDLFVSGGNIPNTLFHNNGDGTFTKILSGAEAKGGGPGIIGGAVSWVDYDNDGFLDLFVGVNYDNNVASSQGTNVLYHNNGNSNAWIEVKLIGTIDNRSAIGAKVRLHATIGGKTFWQLREINTGGGYNNPPLVAHFGLGDATNVDALRVEWPSGALQEFQNIAPRQILSITEPPRLSAILTNDGPQFTLKGGRNLSYEIDSSSDLKSWVALGAVTITNLSGTTNVWDTNAPALDKRFYRAIMR